MRAPILALQGGADQAISHDDNLAFEHALRKAGKDYELVEFKGAPHSFFDRKQEEFQEAARTPGAARSPLSKRTPEWQGSQTGRFATSVARTAILCDA
jgi:dienelactone hydrolase